MLYFIQQVFSRSISLSANQNLDQLITVDKTVGRDTLVQVSTNDGYNIGIKVTGPDQTVYQQTQTKLGVTTLKIPDLAKVQCNSSS